MENSIYSGDMERFIKLLTIDQQYVGFVKNGIVNIHQNERLEISDNNYDVIGSGFSKRSPFTNHIPSPTVNCAPTKFKVYLYGSTRTPHETKHINVYGERVPIMDPCEARLTCHAQRAL